MYERGHYIKVLHIIIRYICVTGAFNRVASNVDTTKKAIKETVLVFEISGFHNKDGVISNQNVKEQPIRLVRLK